MLSDYKPSIAIVILNYNGRSFLEQFLPSVIRSKYVNKRIIVADNDSSDDSVVYVKDHFPGVDIILNNENFGFAEGYNQALNKIDADYFVLLNSDVEVTPEWLEPVLALMESDDKIAVCQPKILSYTQKEMFEYAGAGGGFIDKLGYPLARGRIFETIEKDRGQYNNTRPIFWASGCAMFVRASVYKELGGLYAYFFAHQEEIDFCWRAQLAGYKIMYCGASHVFHVGGGTLSKGQYKKTYLNFRNNLIMLSRNLQRGEKYGTLFLRLVLDGVFAIKSLLTGDMISFKAVFFAHMHFYRWSLFNRRKSNIEKRSLRQLTGVVNVSVVYQYFIRHKKIFSEIAE